MIRIRTIIGYVLTITLHIQVAFAQNIADCGVAKDKNGNIYSTIVLGDDCWFRENLRTTVYPDGSSISPAPLPSKLECKDTRNPGMLYTWFSVLNNSEPTEETDGRVQGPCPDGWHVPSNFEWMNLEDFVGYKNYFRCGEDVNNVAKALACQEYWENTSESEPSPCAISTTEYKNNTTGFSILPSGSFWNGEYAGVGTEAGFWTCSNGGEETAPIHFFYSDNAKVEINCTPKDAFYSVRCVKNRN